MRVLKFLLWFLVIVFVGVFIFAQFKSKYTYKDSLKIYGTESKVYNYIASHLSKRSFYKNIQTEGTDIQPFEEGNISKIRFGKNSFKVCQEKIIKLEPEKRISKVVTCPTMEIESTIKLGKNYKTIQLDIDESITIKSSFLKPLFLFDQSRLHQLRESHYMTWKTLIESYPDEKIHPDMLK